MGSRNGGQQPGVSGADRRRARFSQPDEGKNFNRGRQERKTHGRPASRITACRDEPAQEGLRRNSLNLPRLAFIGLAYFSLAPVIYLNMGFMETDSGGP
jgi:hypothetical protein